MSYAKAFLRDLSKLPAYRKRLIAAGQAWRDRVEEFTYAQSYSGSWGQQRSRRILRLLPAGGLPAVKAWAIYLHGGAWTFGQPDDFIAVANLFLPRGYGLLMPTYRRLPRYHCGQMLADFRLALVDCSRRGWLLPDQSSPILAGMSSGGHLAALLALSPQLWRESGWTPPEKIICCGAPLDLDKMPRYPGLSRLRRGPGEDNPKALLRAINQVPQFCLIHPTQDGMAPLPQARSFYNQLRTKSPDSRLHLLTGEGHLAAGRWIFQADEARKILLDFLKADSAV